MKSGLLKMFPTNYSLRNQIFDIYVYEQDFALNNLYGLICHKIQPNQILYIYI